MPGAPRRQDLHIDGPAGLLEAMIEIPETASGDRVAVICHPHPQFQGTMHNKVVHTLARVFNDLSMPAIRFNFRGVGKSAGEYADGVGEIDDAVAVAEYARSAWPGAEIWLAGFSFGGAVAACAAATIKPTQLVSIAPAVRMLGLEPHALPDMPWLIVQGDADDVVPCDDVVAWHKELDPAPELIVMPNVGHFFHGYLVDLRSLLVERLS